MTLVLVALTIALGAALQSASGFGFSLICVPILAVLVGAKVAVVGTTTLGPLLTLSLAVAGLRDIRWRIAAFVVGASLLGMPLGLFVLTHVGSRLLTIVIASLVITLTLALMLGMIPGPQRGMDGAAGFVSGVLATSTGTNGPPLVLALQARGLPQRPFRATLSAAFLAQSSLAVAGFALTGQYTHAVLRVVAAGVPGLLGGWVLGQLLFHWLDERRFRWLIRFVLLASGVFSMTEALVSGAP
jgi:uncharacterized membrane protein YfcA